MFELGQEVKILDPNLEEQGELLSKETVEVLKATKGIGEVTQIQDGLFYVGFKDEEGNWVTQVFKEEELGGVN